MITRLLKPPCIFININSWGLAELWSCLRGLQLVSHKPLSTQSPAHSRFPILLVKQYAAEVNMGHGESHLRVSGLAHRNSPTACVLHPQMQGFESRKLQTFFSRERHLGGRGTQISKFEVYRVCSRRARATQREERKSASQSRCEKHFQQSIDLMQM